jgi:ribonuclease HI
MTKVVINTDGGSRGNPGPAAIGAVVDGREYGEYIGKTTNNVAEYSAVIFALKKAKTLLGGDQAGNTDVEVRADSELLVNQLNGQYKIKNKELQPLFIEVWNLKQDFKSVAFVHVPRGRNRVADALVNRTLDTLI